MIMKFRTDSTKIELILLRCKEIYIKILNKASFEKWGPSYSFIFETQAVEC